VTSISFYGEGEQDINLQLRDRRILEEKKEKARQGLCFDLQEFRHKGLHGFNNIINRHAIHASVINRTFPEHTG